MKDIIINNITREQEYDERGVGEPFVYKTNFEIGQNIRATHRTYSAEPLTEEEIEERIRTEIYGNNNNKDIGTLTATIGLDTTEFQEKVNEIEGQLDRLEEKAKEVMKIYPKELIETAEDVKTQILADIITDTISMLVYKE